MLKIGCIVGEVSGDKLAKALFIEIQKKVPCSIEGIVGPELRSIGAKQLYDKQALSVMGFIEPFKKLPTLWRIRKGIIQHFLKNPPDVFIGVDAPDFNLGIARVLKKAGIKTIHYVSPSVWAWRQYRVHNIQKAVDLMLTLFPFEAKFFEKHDIPVVFVGHPFADEIPIEIDKHSARETLQITAEKKILALLPGSRNMEIHYLAKDFLLAAQKVFQKNQQVTCILPLVCEEHKLQIQHLMKQLKLTLPIQIVVNQTRLVLAASDMVLTTSGTATLEALLHKKPMVVAYRLNWFMYWIAKHLVNIPYIALPNILAGKQIVPEFIQYFSPNNLAQAILNQFNQDQTEILNEYHQLHKLLKHNASATAAQAVLNRLLQ